MSADDHPATVAVEVGGADAETADVPQQVGEFDHRSVQNGETITWERRYQPREPGEYPYVAVRYAVTSATTDPEASGASHVSRAVVACSQRRDVPNLPHASESGPIHSEEVVARQTVADGFAAVGDALPVAVRLMETKSADGRLPPELTDSQREGYHQLAAGKVDQ
jgi:hypothetical protein